MENNMKAQIKFKPKPAMLIPIAIYIVVISIFIFAGIREDYYSGRYVTVTDKYWYGIQYACKYDNDSSYSLYTFSWFLILLWILLYIIPIIVLLLDYRRSKLCELTVTEREVSGAYTTIIPIFKKTLKMPIEKIDNIVVMNGLQEKLSFGKRIVISSTAGKISFPYVWNADEIVEKVLASMGRKSIQEPSISAPREEQNSASSVIGKIKELSELKNAGIITEEEFELKKKELLGKM